MSSYDGSNMTSIQINLHQLQSLACRTNPHKLIPRIAYRAGEVKAFVIDCRFGSIKCPFNFAGLASPHARSIGRVYYRSIAA